MSDNLERRSGTTGQSGAAGFKPSENPEDRGGRVDGQNPGEERQGDGNTDWKGPGGPPDSDQAPGNPNPRPDFPGSPEGPNPGDEGQDKVNEDWKGVNPAAS